MTGKNKWRFYSRNADVQLTPHFHLHEFECNCKKCPCTWIKKDLLARLQAFRNKLGRPIIINSAYRCPEHNEAEGGVERSYHQLGMAIDIKVKGMTPEQLSTAADPFFSGVGLYNSFVHVDVRKNPKRFDNRS